MPSLNFFFNLVIFQMFIEFHFIENLSLYLNIYWRTLQILTKSISNLKIRKYKGREKREETCKEQKKLSENIVRRENLIIYRHVYTWIVFISILILIYKNLTALLIVIIFCICFTELYYHLKWLQAPYRKERFRQRLYCKKTLWF